VYGFQIRQFVIIGIYARAKEQAGVPTIHDLAAAPELDEVGLVLLVARRYEAVDLAFELDFLFVVVGRVPFCETCFASVVWV